MSYWWVNQGQTYDEERRGSYLWSPKRASDGSRRSYYDAMTDVAVDDVVFHYVSKPDAYVRSLSLVTGPATSAEQPPELRHTDMWNDDGWRVEVRHVDRIRQIPRDLAIDLGAGESPFTRNGRVNQGYLYPLTDAFGVTLVDLADPREDIEPRASPRAAVHETAVTVPLEEGTRLQFEQVITPARRQATRSEWALVDRFVADTGIDRTRRRYMLQDGTTIFCDIFVKTPPALVEAKASASRSAVREGIGQLHDYEHKEPGAVRKILLLPNEPAPDLLEVCERLNVAVVWPGGTAWDLASSDFAGWLQASAGE